MSDLEMVEMRTYCSSCESDIAECEPRKMVAAPKDPVLLAIVRARGFMRSHSSCAHHFHLEMAAARAFRPEDHAK